MKRLLTSCTLFLIFILSGCGKKEVKHESYVYIPHSEVIADDAMVFYSTFRNDKLYYIEGRLEVGQIVYSLCITDYLTEQTMEQELTVYKHESIVDICVTHPGALRQGAGRPDAVPHHRCHRWPPDLQ